MSTDVMNRNGTKSYLLNSVTLCAVLVAVEYTAFCNLLDNSGNKRESFCYFLSFSLAYGLIGFGSIVVMVRRDLVPHLIAYYLALLVLFVSAFNFVFLNAVNTLV